MVRLIKEIVKYGGSYAIPIKKALIDEGLLEKGKKYKILIVEYDENAYPSEETGVNFI
jgi:hypothetical protein